ncbi:MAG: hypothetical protein HOO67_00755 [Candidatus Peribacteraceae bacterium]|nr:hypothetical protein [Candidatus Peribacteraceae bacterium]
MDSLASILPRVLHKRGLHGHATAALATHKATEWLHAALPSFASQLHVDTFKDGVLTISTTHSIAAQECMPLLPGLKEFLLRECKGSAVREVRMVRARGRKANEGNNAIKENEG